MKKRVLICLIASAIVLCCLRSGSIYADCTACFELRGVKIELRNGNVCSGYVAWNSSWFEAQGFKPQFPDSLIDIKMHNQVAGWRGQPLTVYKKPYSVEKPFKKLHSGCNPGKVLVTTEADTVKLPLKQIKSIKAVPMKHDGYSGAGGLPLYPKNTLKMLLDKEPVALITEDISVADEYYISYNPAIGEKELKAKIKAIHNGIAGETWEESMKKLEKEGIVVLSVGYD